MNTRPLHTLFLALGVLGAVLTLTVPARAADKRTEAAAKVALKKAEADFAASAFDKGLARLQKAATACGDKKCTTKTKAALLRDIGSMQFRKGDKSAATASFAAALALAPDLTLNPKYDMPDMSTAFEAARGGGGGGGGGTAGGGEQGGGGGGAQPSGDFTHTPATEQAAKTPVPIYVEYEAKHLARVIVKYKGEGMSEFKRVELPHKGDGWGGYIPCDDVTVGTMRYYIQGFDEGGDPAATSGDPKHTFTVPIRDSISSEPPSLPGTKAPKTCTESGGGEEGKGKLEEGADCEEDDACASGSCKDGKCAAGAAPEAGAFEHWWVGISASVDILFLPQGNDVCRLNPQTAVPSGAGYYCTNPDGSDFPTRFDNGAQNSTLTQGNAGVANGGPSLGMVRVMASLDYAFTQNILAGARVGYIFGRYGGSAAGRDGHGFGPPLHLEVRGTYLFGAAPLSHEGFAPMVFAGGGLSEFDSSTTVQVVQTGITGQQAKTAWVVNGPGFIDLGGGIRYALSPRAAATLDLKMTGAFGGFTTVFVLAPELGLAYGF